MKELLKSLINKLFYSPNNYCQSEDDVIKIFLSKYQSANDEMKIFLLKEISDVLRDIKIFSMSKWCLILSNCLSKTPKKPFEFIIDIFLPKTNEQYSLTHKIGRRFGLLITLNSLISIIDEIKIDEEVLSKLIFVASQLIVDPLVGLIASVVLSRYIYQLPASNLSVTMKQIIQLTFTKHANIEQNPHLYLILLSLKEEHIKILQTEDFNFPDLQSTNHMNNLINILKKCNNNIISVYFNGLVLSNLFKMFWELLIDIFDKDKINFLEKEILLNCLMETISPIPSSGFDLATECQKLKTIDIVWGNSRMWNLFFTHLSDDKSLFHGTCKNTILRLNSTSIAHLNIIALKLFDYFLSTADRECHMKESKILQKFRLSQVLIRSIDDKTRFLKYIILLTNFLQSDCDKDEENIFVIEQLAFICHCSSDVEIHNTSINKIISVQIQYLSKHSCLSESVRRASFSSLIACIHHSATSRQISMSEYLIYLNSVIHMVIDNLDKDSTKFNTLWKLFKSLSKYIDDQLCVKYNDEAVVSKVFPCFGSVICYLSLFLLSKIDLKNYEKSLGLCNKIIDWIKQCFQAAHRSIEKAEIPCRKRMLSVSSLCSDDEHDTTDPPKHSHWSFYLLDILLKIYDEDANLMNKAVNSIISFMVRMKTLDISGIRYIKNLILSENARKKKISEFDSVIFPDISSPLPDHMNQQNLKLWHLKERCLNILSTIILEGDDVDLIASCLFIMLEICSSGDSVLINQIETLIETFKEKSKDTEEFYLNSENLIRAINSIVVLSNEISHYNNFDVMASKAIIGLINRSQLTVTTIDSLNSMLNDSLFGSISSWQKSVLQNVFMEHSGLSWQLRESLFKCISNKDLLRLVKYKAFCILKNIFRSSPHNKRFSISFDNKDFFSKVIPSVVEVLMSFNFESLNVKYFSTVMECLIGLYITNPEIHKLPEHLINNLQNISCNKNRQDISGIVNKFLEIYKYKNLNIPMCTLEEIEEYDKHVSYLLKLLPPEFNKDFDTNVKKVSNNHKSSKESKTESKFNMINRKRKMEDKKTQKNNKENKTTEKVNNESSAAKKQKIDRENVESSFVGKENVKKQTKNEKLTKVTNKSEKKSDSVVVETVVSKEDKSKIVSESLESKPIKKIENKNVENVVIESINITKSNESSGEKKKKKKHKDKKKVETPASQMEVESTKKDKKKKDKADNNVIIEPINLMKPKESSNGKKKHKDKKKNVKTNTDLQSVVPMEVDGLKKKKDKSNDNVVIESINLTKSNESANEKKKKKKHKHKKHNVDDVAVDNKAVSVAITAGCESGNTTKKDKKSKKSHEQPMEID